MRCALCALRSEGQHAPKPERSLLRGLAIPFPGGSTSATSAPIGALPGEAWQCSHRYRLRHRRTPFSLADVGSELVGVEISKRMCSFANRQARRRGFNNVQILFGDGAKLENFSAGSFDYAIACMVLHEMDASQRLPVLKEMQRLAPNIILVDYRVPPPANLAVTMCRFIERLAGHRHFRNYTSFTNNGGLLPLYETLGLSVQREISFYSHCLHLVTTQ